MRKLWVLIVVINFLLLDFASSGEFVEVYEGRSLYTEYKRAQKNHPTIILLNGMTYSTHQWDKLLKIFHVDHPEAGTLTYDMYGMGETKKKYKTDFFPFSSTQISYQEQARELWLLIKKLDIQGPIVLAGLSYGAGIAQYFMKEYGSLPEIRSAILMSPFIEPLKNQVDWIKFQVQRAKWMYPFNPLTDDQLYDFYLKLLVYTTYPVAEPIVLEHPVKLEATFRLAQGMNKFNGYDFVNDFPAKSIHLVVPLMDEYIDQTTFDKYWQSLPPSVRASRLLIKNGRHKLPEQMPDLVSKWIAKVAYDPYGDMDKGKTFESYKMRSCSGSLENDK
jgi:pimeloyl-ACP methyl ester carboxylesterase